MRRLTNSYRRLVVKIGSSLFYNDKNRLDYGSLQNIAAQLSSLKKAGIETVAVSSGAIALGMSSLNLKSRPKELPMLQAAASVGQNELMNAYSRLFKTHGLKCAQLLLTWEDFTDRKRYLNAKNTLLALLKLGVIPIINENDTVSTDEIKFGDNDKLSALVAQLLPADILIILSDVAGFLDTNKSVIPKIGALTPQIRKLAGSTLRNTSVGGMNAKLDAAKIVLDSGIPCVITSGKVKDSIQRTLRGEPGGTLFEPVPRTLAAKKRWIAFGSKARGKICVDEGAKRALLNKKSLLSVGVADVGGEFGSGDIVSITDKSGAEFARGRCSISSKDLEKVKGTRFDKEIIHCDNLVVL